MRYTESNELLGFVDNYTNITFRIGSFISVDRGSETITFILSRRLVGDTYMPTYKAVDPSWIQVSDRPEWAWNQLDFKVDEELILTSTWRPATPHERDTLMLKLISAGVYYDGDRFRHIFRMGNMNSRIYTINGGGDIASRFRNTSKMLLKLFSMNNYYPTKRQANKADIVLRDLLRDQIIPDVKAWIEYKSNSKNSEMYIITMTLEVKQVTTKDPVLLESYASSGRLYGTKQYATAVAKKIYNELFWLKFEDEWINIPNEVKDLLQNRKLLLPER